MGDWTVITRDDGTKQWAYKGKPLYYFAQDTTVSGCTTIKAVRQSRHALESTIQNSRSRWRS